MMRCSVCLSAGCLASRSARNIICGCRCCARPTKRRLTVVGLELSVMIPVVFVFARARRSRMASASASCPASPMACTFARSAARARQRLAAPPARASARLTSRIGTGDSALSRSALP